MIDSLHIENIAVIKTLDVDFSDGFTILTGETGAGKSIIIDSIQLLLGGRSDKDLVRNGEKSALVSAIFTDLPNELRDRLVSFGLCSEEERDELDTVMIQRTLSADGRSTARLSGKPITLQMLREIGSELLTIHGQNDNGRLLRKSTHLSLLDRYADSEELLERYRTAYASYKAVAAEEADYRKSEGEKERLREILSYQIRDIDAGKLKEGEEEQLLKERNQLQYAEKIAKNTDFCYRALKGSEKGSVALLLEKSESALRAISGILPEAGALADRITTCRFEILDVAESVASISDLDCDDPTARLNAVEDRLEAINRLERKYGATVSEVLAFRIKIAEELSHIENGPEYLAELILKKQQLETVAKELALRLSDRRREAALQLQREVLSVLSFLDMPKVQFSVSIERTEELTATGTDNVEFLISTNPSEPLAPLIKIASGGELSRIMLALRSVFLNKEGVGSLIFDEIDTGISGKTSQKVGIKLRALAKEAQVLCITHSPQIAALADHHYRIEKREINGRNETTLKPLDEDGRVDEVARILGGIRITETQKQSAKELIEDGKKY